MIFDTIAALADYLNNGKFDNSASRAQCEDALREFLRTDQETLTVDGRTVFNNEGKRLSYFIDAIQSRTPRSEYEENVSDYESSSSSSSSSFPSLFQLELTVASSDKYLKLWYANSVNFTIDWGDGYTETVNGGTQYSDYIGHTYSAAGVYTISLSGQTSWFEVGDGVELEPSISRILTPIVGITGLTSLSNTFFGIGITEIPADLFDYSCENVTDFSYVFQACNYITSIPNALFFNCQNATYFRAAFYSSGITSIPSDLFDNCPNVTSFHSIFRDCPNLTSIPSGLFSNCLNVTNFEQTFYYCTNLTGDAPEFWTRDPEPDGSLCFHDDTGLTNYASIPAGWK